MVSTNSPPTSSYRFWRAANLDPIKVDWVQVAGNTQFSIPPPAPQPGGSPSLNTSDARILRGTGLADNVWASHSLGCTNASLPNEACARIIGATMSSDFFPGATFFQQSTFGCGDGISCWMPAVAVDSSQRTAVSLLRSSATEHLSAGWTMKAAADPNYTTYQSIRTGDCRRVDGSPAQTGDFTGAHPSSALTSFWLTGESAKRIPTELDPCFWTTTIVHVN